MIEVSIVGDNVVVKPISYDGKIGTGANIHVTAAIAIVNYFEKYEARKEELKDKVDAFLMACTEENLAKREAFLGDERFLKAVRGELLEGIP